MGFLVIAGTTNTVLESTSPSKSLTVQQNYASFATSACRKLIARGISVINASSMCRRLMVSGVSIGAAATFSPHALANPNNTAVVSVNIPEIVELSTHQVTVEAHLNGQAINNLQVGSVTVKSNAANGYKVTVTSVNNGLLKMTDSSQPTAVPYTFSYDTASGVSLSGTAENPLTIENKTSANSDYLACATAAGCNRSLAINVKDSEANKKPAGIYRDILRFNIIAN